MYKPEGRVFWNIIPFKNPKHTDSDRSHFHTYLIREKSVPVLNKQPNKP